jgi:hypothetical protein
VVSQTRRASSAPAASRNSHGERAARNLPEIELIVGRWDIETVAGVLMLIMGVHEPQPRTMIFTKHVRLRIPEKTMSSSSSCVGF